LLAKSNSENVQFVEVALDLPLPQTFTYAVQDAAKRLRVGTLVQVPFRQKTMSGIILKVYDHAPKVSYKIRKVSAIVKDFPLLTPPMVQMLSFMASYYHEPIGLCINLAIPHGLMRDGTCVYQWGRAPRPEDGLSDEECKNLEKVAELLAENALTASELCKSANISYFQLDAWLDKGIVHGNWKLEQKRREESSVIYIEAIKDVESKRKLGTKQESILQLIKTQGRLTTTTLNQHFGYCGNIVRRLEELGLVRSYEETQHRFSFDDCVTESNVISLSDEQNEAIESILAQNGFKGFLLHGVTGSGKTEVYLRVMEQLRNKGKGALLILPEISLTPQFCAIFRGRFGDDVAVLHSQLSEAERFDAWARIQSGRVHIALGARSALFAPVQNLGLIVVDEEHDGSFKQSESPRYHARDMALVLGKQWDCPVILGSATPSLESFTKAKNGKLHYLSLCERPLARPMPELKIIDMSSQNRKQLDPDLAATLDADARIQIELEQRLISPELCEAITQTLERREQVIVFLNRRGYSTFIQCDYCGHAIYCPHCAVSLTYHQYAKQLRCHYCNYEQAIPEHCPKCLRPDLGRLGYGTERLVGILQKRFPTAQIERLDRDRASAAGLRNILDRFRTGSLDILVGTQMLAKGHDIHNVTLVGVISADLSLNFPDFRASERCFQILTQVAGRAGRGNRQGRVLIQSLVPEHPVLKAVIASDYNTFALNELRLRHALAYPPFHSLILIRIEGEDISSVERLAQFLAQIARRHSPKDGVALGPAPAPILILRGNSRYQIMLKHQHRSQLHTWLQKIQHHSNNIRKNFAKIKVIIDIDPLDMM
jgi:primosomal protein N' (replication factor Y)